MKQQVSTSDIVAAYATAMNLKLVHKLFFFLASLSISIWFLCPVLFGNRFPLPYSIVLVTVIVVWILITLPRHLRLTGTDERFGRLLFNPLLSMRCALAAVKPSATDTKKCPGLIIMYYFSIAAPIVCLVISVPYAMGKGK